jgi:hypothetical protein
MIHWTHTIGFLKGNREMETLADLNRLDIARPNEVMLISRDSSNVWKGILFPI